MFPFTLEIAVQDRRALIAPLDGKNCRAANVPVDARNCSAPVQATLSAPQVPCTARVCFEGPGTAVASTNAQI